MKYLVGITGGLGLSMEHATNWKCGKSLQSFCLSCSPTRKINFWHHKHGCEPPPSYCTWLGPLLLQINMSAPFPGCPWNSGTITAWSRCESKMSFPAVSEMLNLLQIWKGNIMKCTTMAKNRSMYFTINLVWGLTDTPLYRNNHHIEDDLGRGKKN